MNGKPAIGFDYASEGILVLGNEGHGIREEIEALINEPITIPLLGKAESLNVSVAGSVLMAEIRRSQLTS